MRRVHLRIGVLHALACSASCARNPCTASLCDKFRASNLLRVPGCVVHRLSGIKLLTSIAERQQTMLEETRREANYTRRLWILAYRNLILS